jgi:hypothetical protein
MRKIRKGTGQNITVEGIGYKVEGVYMRSNLILFVLDAVVLLFDFEDEDEDDWSTFDFAI